MIDTRKLILTVALAVAGSFSSLPAAEAMPIDPSVSAPTPLVQDVSWPCGPGWRPNRWGRCVPKWGPPPYRRPHHWRHRRHW